MKGRLPHAARWLEFVTTDCRQAAHSRGGERHHPSSTAPNLARRAAILSASVPDLMFIRKQKRPDGSGFWGAYKTGEDAFGAWLFTPRGSLYRGEQAGSTAYCHVGSPAGPGIPVMHLVPRAAWWIATFWAPAEVRWSLTFDVSTPPRLDGSVWSYVDLELDVWVDAMTGSVHLDDEDEFVAACADGTISPAEARAARLAADDIRTLVRRRKGEFGRAGAARLLEGVALHLAPITILP